MPRYNTALIHEVRRLRMLGKTYGEINTQLHQKIPKSTLAEWCKSVSLPQAYAERIAKLNIVNLHKGRLIGQEINKIKREEFLTAIKQVNTPIATSIHKIDVAKIALAMLCLGEASKYTKTRKAFTLGSSDPRIIVIFLELLKRYYPFSPEKVRCTVQCRADQDIERLESFWRKITKVPRHLFYKARIDPRTKGIATKKENYKGVLRVDYMDTKVQLELEALADLVYNQLKLGPVAQW